MNRLIKVQKRLGEWGVDLLFVDNPIDLFYLTGEELSAGHLIISEKEATLYVDGRYYESCKKRGSLPVMLLSGGAPLPSYPGRRIGFDAHCTTYETYEKLGALKGELISLPSPMRTLRAVKEPGEIEHLRVAAHLCCKGYDFVASHLIEGVMEKELATELEIFWRRAGGERLGFAPHIAFGDNSAYPHYHAGSRSLKKGDVVLIDIGVVLDHYHSDMTRVIFFGEPNKELQRLYRIVEEAVEEALKLCKPGTPLADLDAAARGLIESKGYGEYFLHSLGHGVGLEIHEAPWVRKGGEGLLGEGMVLTIEPGIYLPGLGGIRLEDTIVITKEGFEILTQ